MTALFINLKIDNQEKFDLFKSTLSEIEYIFYECHIKIRGELSEKCIKFTKELFSNRANFYQELNQKDWVASTLSMINNVKSRSIFFYLEDHKLVTTAKELNLVLEEFEENQLDYLCYSFFRASRLNTNNLLPLNPKNGKKISQFILDKKNLKLIGSISPLYYTFSLASISSTDYFKKLLIIENSNYKFYYRKLSTIISIIFSYPKYRIVISFINKFLNLFSFRLCFYPYDSPFNMEKINIEVNSTDEKWKYGVLKKELFANFDDDNNAYGESLIKRGLYPSDIYHEVNSDSESNANFIIKLKAGEVYNCCYYSQIHRVRKSPKVFIKVIYGKSTVIYGGKEITLKNGDHKGFYSNLSPLINCIDDSEIMISVHDECFG